ncbi:MAG: stage V sporulation protein AE [Firmicutes bacterium]|nr:stage V sporulation protein AE [Bacillota bacterium]
MEYLWAFIIGGGLCLIGQVLMDGTTLTTPRVLVIFVVAGVILEALGLYEPLVELAGNGATVPLTGFGYNLAKGAIEGASDGFIGAITGPLKNSAAGIGIALTLGYIISLVFTPKSPKR